MCIADWLLLRLCRCLRFAGAVGIVTSIAATCTTKNPEGFTAGNHILTLQAAAANTNLTGCAAPDAKTLTALVVVLNPPTIAMSPVKLQDATCSNSRNINVRFNYEVIDGGSSPILSVLGATPRLQGSNVRPGAAQQIKCKPTLQGEQPPVLHTSCWCSA